MRTPQQSSGPLLGSEGKDSNGSAAACDAGCVLVLVTERAPCSRVRDAQVVVSIEEAGRTVDDLADNVGVAGLPLCFRSDMNKRSAVPCWGLPDTGRCLRERDGYGDVQRTEQNMRPITRLSRREDPNRAAHTCAEDDPHTQTRGHRLRFSTDRPSTGHVGRLCQSGVAELPPRHTSGEWDLEFDLCPE